ncbi:MAG: CheR family methyltransferase [Coleofasciculus sp. A1-SPW-01]|uniref:CheR family methyltransferase n=1 Tax=Coleofasciculus sp. A1-SPW-01 TaxID=3070819 RepID=UPI0033026DCA
MKDTECVRFLQWALPQLNLRWAGFRKVRKQACKRIQRRIFELGLSVSDAYQSYLNTHPEEWTILDRYCRITISIFYRDRQIFQYLYQEILPQLIQLARERGDTELVCWSAGCASGEEAYTLSIIWHLAKFSEVPNLSLRIIATDANAYLLERATTGCYEWGSLK